MTKLTYFRKENIGSGGTYEYVRLYVGHVHLRIINVTSLTSVCKVSLAIVDRNLTDTTVQTISLFHKQVMTEIAADVGWEGDIEIGLDQDLIATFENSVVGEHLILTVGAELL